MGQLARTRFPLGWVPDADRVNGPAEALLRADNLTLDELGALTIRKGSSIISTLSDPDVHSLFTAILSGTTYRLAGATNAVYSNGSSIATGVAGSGDISFGSYLGQVFFARSSTKKKWDGTTVRNWGISMTGTAPTVTASTGATKTFMSGDSTESPAVTVNFDDGSGATFAAGFDGTANGAIVINPGSFASTGFLSIQKDYASPVDFTDLGGGVTATDDDTISIWVYLTSETGLLGITLTIGTNDGLADPYSQDCYTANWSTNPSSDPSQTLGIVVTQFVTGWQQLTIRRGDMEKFFSGASSVGWDTVVGVRINATYSGDRTGVDFAMRFDECEIRGGPLTDDNVEYCYVYVRNSGGSQGKSAPSATTSINLRAQGASITIPSDGSRDSQVNEVWIFRRDAGLDDFYRVYTVTGVSGTGSLGPYEDVLSDADALDAGIILEAANTVPPNNIIGIAGSYYDRIFVLVSDGSLWPSRRLNYDSFSTEQTIQVCGTDETPYWVVKAFGGLAIGTSRDIYRLTGTGAELPDGSVQFTLENMNIDAPPISNAVTVEGSTLVYLAHDGWRAVGVGGSMSLAAGTSLLYRGQSRHGVSAANLTGGRFRAALWKGRVVAMTPEGTSTTSTAVIYRRNMTTGVWERHTYPYNFRVVYREPSGLLIAGDDAGHVLLLEDPATLTDNGTAIAVAWWTGVLDDQPFLRKDPWDFTIRINTGGETSAVDVHLDGSDTASTSLVIAQSGVGVSLKDLSGLATCRQFQLRGSAPISLGVYAFYGFVLNYRDHPVLQAFAEPKPEVASAVRRRFSGLDLTIDTLGADVTVTPVIDGDDLDDQTVNTDDALTRALSFDTVVARDCWGRVVGDTGFELFSLQPRILETLPAQMQGSIGPFNGGTDKVKTLSGLQLRLCTLGVERTITPYVDDVAQTAVTVTSALDTPVELTIAFEEPVEGTEIRFVVDGPIEIYHVAPLISTTRAYGIQAWDSGPIDLGGDIVWLRQVRLGIRSDADVVITPHVDGGVMPAVTAPTTNGFDGVAVVDFGRGYAGRSLRLVLTSTGTFNPRWMELVDRITARATSKKRQRIPLTLAGA